MRDIIRAHFYRSRGVMNLDPALVLKSVSGPQGDKNQKISVLLSVCLAV